MLETFGVLVYSVARLLVSGAEGVFGSVTTGILAAARPVSFLWGILVPGVIFALSFVITWALYRKFAGKPC